MSLTYTTELKSVASAYVKLLKVAVTDSTIEKEIERNPYFPSLYSLAQTFNKYKIDNNAYNITSSEFDQYNIETPFVAFVSLKGKGVSDFVLVTELNEESLSFIHGSKKKQKVSREAFLGRMQELKESDIIYKGILFKATLTEDSGDSLYHNKKTTENKLFVKDIAVLIGVILLIMLAVWQVRPINNSLPFLIILFIKLIGLFVAGLILIYYNDKSNAFIKNLCSISPKTSCDAVLSSTAAKIGNVNMGEVGLVYFSSTLIGLFLPNLDFDTKLFCISVANVIVVPYVFFSIYYQWRIIKNWCLLCLTVQMVFLCEFIWSIVFFWESPHVPALHAQFIYVIIFCVGVPIVIWYYLKPTLIKTLNHDVYLAAYERLQFNPDIFDKLLIAQPLAPTGWETIGLDVGNPTAKHVVIKVCNPYCKPCNEAHSVLHEMLQNSNNIRLKIIFVTRNSASDRGRSIVRHFLQLADNGANLLDVLDAWYLSLSKDYNEFAAKYPAMDDELELQDTKIEAMRKWCDVANISFTPTIFLDGYSLPENYKIEDLAYVFNLSN